MWEKQILKLKVCGENLYFKLDILNIKCLKSDYYSNNLFPFITIHLCAVQWLNLIILLIQLSRYVGRQTH